MKHILSCVILILSLNAVAAQENQKREQVVELMNLMNMPSIMDSMYAQMEVMMQNTSKDLGVKPSEQPILDRYYAKTTRIMREEMSWEKMEPHIVDLYVRNFNEKEISDMLAFYKTDTGRSVLKKLPLLMQESMQFAEQMVKAFLPRLQEAAKELESELREARQSEEGKAKQDKDVPAV